MATGTLANGISWPLMKRTDSRPDWRIGWTAAAIAVTMTLILAIDVAEKQSSRFEPPAQRTEEAVKQAGATLTPSYPDRYP